MDLDVKLGGDRFDIINPEVDQRVWGRVTGVLGQIELDTVAFQEKEEWQAGGEPMLAYHLEPESRIPLSRADCICDAEDRDHHLRHEGTLPSEQARKAEVMSVEMWNDRYAGRDLVWSAAPNQFLVTEVDSLSPGRALDLGCGEGRNAVWLAEQGWDVTAVDFSDVGVGKGREMAAKRGVEVNWVVEDLNSYRPPAGAFDLVIDFYIHLPPDQRQALTRKGATAVAPGGTLLIVGHHLDNLEAGYGGPQDPAVLHLPAVISSGLGDLGIVKAERVERAVATDEGSFVAIDSLVRATAN